MIRESRWQWSWGDPTLRHWFRGFNSQPAMYAAVVEQTAGKRFLNFDDVAFSDDLKRYLQERFPEPCRYER